MQMRTIVLTIAMVTGAAACGHAVKSPAPQPQTVEAPVGASGLKAAKDHGNGPLREPTDDEDAALGPNPSTGVTTVVRAGSVAGTTAILGDDMLSDLVVEKQADGSMKATCGVRGEHPHPHPLPQAQTLETK